MELVSFKLPPDLRRRLAEEARRRHVSVGALIRESLRATLVEHPAARGQLTCADLAGDLIGSFRGPGDLSTNKRYLEEAIVADYLKSKTSRRAKKRRR
jgi:Ribbon-helix-helix protein, copG family